MPRSGRKAIIRAKATHQQKQRKPAPRGARGARSHARVQVKYRGPRISRARLRTMREDLEGTKSAVTETVEKFWIIPEQDIRETLTQTEKKIGRAVKMLQRAA